MMRRWVERSLVSTWSDGNRVGVHVPFDCDRFNSLQPMLEDDQPTYLEPHVFHGGNRTGLTAWYCIKTRAPCSAAGHDLALN